MFGRGGQPSAAPHDQGSGTGGEGMATAPAAIGRWVRREDGASKVTGRTVYTGDLKLPGLLMVEYDEGEAAVDPEAALKDERELVHPKERFAEREDTGTHTSVGGGSETIRRPANASEAMRYRRGDVEAGFREADAVVER